MKNIGVIFANGFEEIEGITIVDVLRRAGLICQMVGLNGETSTGAHGIKIVMDTTFDAFKETKFDAIILPGGMPGAENLRDSRKLIEVLKKTNEAGKLIAAICAAPIALAAAELLHGKNVTCYPGFEKQLTGACITGNRIQVDGNIITGNGPGSAMDFSYQILEYLGCSKQAVELREGMLAK